MSERSVVGNNLGLKWGIWGQHCARLLLLCSTLQEAGMDKT